jgi:hypothetical protein
MVRLNSRNDTATHDLRRHQKSMPQRDETQQGAGLTRKGKRLQCRRQDDSDQGAGPPKQYAALIGCRFFLPALQVFNSPDNFCRFITETYIPLSSNPAGWFNYFLRELRRRKCSTERIVGWVGPPR